eukprot:GFKZ01003910.1.p1 GENE.GFKZ01003910.1~~GFKZ01003910.1.p1  ORF type:complete len:1565 (-),score=298.24 GFKZ01003910.1:1934-6628(-)
MPEQKPSPSSPSREVAADPHSHPVDIDGFSASTPLPTIDLTDDADTPSQPDQENDDDNNEDGDEDVDQDEQPDDIEEAESDEADVEHEVEEHTNSEEEDVDIADEEVEEEVEVDDDVDSDHSVEELDQGEAGAQEDNQPAEDEESEPDDHMHDDVEHEDDPGDHSDSPVEDDAPHSPVEDDATHSMDVSDHDVDRTNHIKGNNDEEQATDIDDDVVLSEKPHVQSGEEGEPEADLAVESTANANPDPIAAEKNPNAEADVKASPETESISLVGSQQEGYNSKAKGDGAEASFVAPVDGRGTRDVALVDKSTPLDSTPHSRDEKPVEEHASLSPAAMEETGEDEKLAEPDVECSVGPGGAEKSSAQEPMDVKKQPVKSDDEPHTDEVRAVDIDEGHSSESKPVPADSMEVDCEEDTAIDSSQQKEDKADGSTVSDDVEPDRTAERGTESVFDSTGAGGSTARPESSTQAPRNSAHVADVDFGFNAGSSAGKQSIPEKCDEGEKDPTLIPTGGHLGIQKERAGSADVKGSGDGDVTMAPAPKSSPKTPSLTERGANITSPMFGIQPPNRRGPVKFSSPPSFHRPPLNPAAKPFIPSPSQQPTKESSAPKSKQLSADNDAESTLPVKPVENKAPNSTTPSSTPSKEAPDKSSEGQKEKLEKLSAAPSESQESTGELAPTSGATVREPPAEGLGTPFQPQQQTIAKTTEAPGNSRGITGSAKSEGSGSFEEDALKKLAVSAQVPKDNSEVDTGTPSQRETAGGDKPISEQPQTSANANTDSMQIVQSELSAIPPAPTQLHSEGPQAMVDIQPPSRPPQQTAIKEAKVPVDQVTRAPQGALTATGIRTNSNAPNAPSTAGRQLPEKTAIPTKKRNISNPSPLPLKAMGTGLTTAKSIPRQSARGRGGVEQTLRRIPAKGTSGGMTYCVENVSVSVKHGAGKPIRRSELCTIELMTIPNGESKMEFSDIRTVPKNVWLTLSSTKDTVKIMKVTNKPFIMSITVLGPSKRENGHDSTKYFIHLRQSTFQVFYDACLKFILDFVPEKDRPSVVKFTEPAPQDRRTSNVAASSSSASRTRAGPPTPHKMDSGNQKESQKKLLQQKLAALQKKKAERTAEATTQRVPAGAGKNKDPVVERATGKLQPEMSSFRPNAPVLAPSATPSGPSNVENKGLRGNAPSLIPLATSRKGGAVIQGHTQAEPFSGSGNMEKPPSRGPAPPTTPSGPTRIPTVALRNTHAPMEISTPYPRNANPTPTTEDGQGASTKVSEAVGRSLGPGSKNSGLHEKPVGAKVLTPGIPIATISTPPQRPFAGARMGMQKGLIPPTSPKKRPAFRTEEGGGQSTKRARVSLPWRRQVGEGGKGAVSIGLSESARGDGKGQIAGIGSRPAQLRSGWVGTGVFGSVNKSAGLADESREVQNVSEGEGKRPENDRQRAQDLLAVMKELVMETGKEKLQEKEGSLERCDAESRADFLARLHTFKPSTWMHFGKEHVLSAAECARRGWYNSGKGRLRSNEGAEIVARFEECKGMKEWKTEEERVKGLVEGGEGHVLLSGWRKGICSEEFGRLEGGGM